MADFTLTVPENISGKYFIDEECIDCRLCRDISPSVFFRNDTKGYHFVGKQPDTHYEEKQAQEALESCPVESIGINLKK